jgi:LPS-assembly protein
VSGKRRILPVAISCLLTIPAAQAAQPTWECRTSADGQSWECFKDGVLVAPEPVAAEPVTPRIEKAPAESQPEAIAAEPAAEPAPAISAAEPPAQAAEATQPTAEEAPPAADEAEAVAAQAPAEETPRAETAPSQPIPVPDHAPADTAEQAVATTEQPETPAPISTARIDRGLDWGRCGPPTAMELRRIKAAQKRAPKPPLDPRTYIAADSAEVSQQEEAGTFSGNVEVRRADELVEADEIHYNNVDDVLDARGNVYYEKDYIRFTSSTGTLNLTTGQGHLDDVDYRLTDRMARGNADSVDIEDRNRSHLQEISYTTCQPGNSDWVLEAAEMDLDRETGVGEATHARVSFKGVPFLYTPWVTFPIDDRRKSGLLTPTIGQSEETGFDVAIPYYLNLAPNYDATITPRIMSKRGVMLAGEFRYLQENHYGEIAGEILPDDAEQERGEDKTRGALSMQGKGQLAPRLTYDMDINHVSDDTYLEDFGGSLSVSSARHQERRGDLLYRGNYWSLLGRAQHFQTLDNTLTARQRPYNRLPQVLLRAKGPSQAFGLTYGLRGEYVRFDKSDAVRGDRLDLYPTISLPLRRPWGFLTPKLSARYTDYRLEDEGAGNPDSPSRTLPIFSLDGGLFFDRDTEWFGTRVEQTLEPRLFYVLIPDEDQDDIPVFDSANRGFSFSSLFQENRFTGADRVGDTNQLTMALTSRTMIEGRELLRASLGQIFYFEDRDVQLWPTQASQEDDSSAIVGELAAHLTDHWSTRANVQWNPHAGEHKTEKSNVQLRYIDPKQRIFNLAYRYNKKLLEQTDMSARWPMGNKLHLLARWNYSWMYDQTMESFGGIEYDGCCWKIRGVVRNYVNDVDEESNTAFFLQLELKGLSSFGSDIDSLLEQGILGYSPDR